MSDEQTSNSTVTGPLWQQAFVLEQHELYGALAGQVRAIRRQLLDGEHLTAVLVAETQQILNSPMTREQIASALVPVMARVAQGEDLLASGAGTAPLVVATPQGVSIDQMQRAVESLRRAGVLNLPSAGIVLVPDGLTPPPAFIEQMEVDGV